MNDPEIAPRVGRAAGSALVPRTAVTDGWRGVWSRSGAGLWQLPPGAHPRDPVTSVSWHDANVYAAWLTRRLRSRGYPVSCELPTHQDWHAAANPVGAQWRYVFGPHFRPKWTHGNNAHRQPARGPVMTHPIDASAAGIYDMAGSVMEWSADWFWEEQGWRTFRCAAWSFADPKMFETQFAQGELPEWTSGALGFRLVARPDE